MAINTSFNPAYGRGVVVSPGATTASSEIGVGSKSIVLTNLGDNVCYVRSGASGVTATTADYPVLSGQQVSLGKFQDDTHVAYISADGTSLHIIAGEGM
jgi:hypothetical protein